MEGFANTQNSAIADKHGLDEGHLLDGDEANSGRGFWSLQAWPE
jgi:hypothetical protein